MFEDTVGPHRRVYIDKDGREAHVEVDDQGYVTCMVEMFEELLSELGFKRKPPRDNAE